MLALIFDGGPSIRNQTATADIAGEFLEGPSHNKAFNLRYMNNIITFNNYLKNVDRMNLRDMFF